jgi:hypothetical protein
MTIPIYICRVWCEKPYCVEFLLSNQLNQTFSIMSMLLKTSDVELLLERFTLTNYGTAA